MRITKTPGVSGRIIDSVTGLAIVHAAVRFVDGNNLTNFDDRAVSTDSNGHFEFARTFDYIAGGVIWNPMGGGKAIAGNEAWSTWLRIESPGYESKFIDLRHEYSVLRYFQKKIPQSEPEDVIRYGGLIPLQDIPLARVKNEPKPPKPTAPSGGGSA